jgi:hypothetical protein
MLSEMVFCEEKKILVVVSTDSVLAFHSQKKRRDSFSFAFWRMSDDERTQNTFYFLLLFNVNTTTHNRKCVISESCTQLRRSDYHSSWY